MSVNAWTVTKNLVIDIWVDILPDQIFKLPLALQGSFKGKHEKNMWCFHKKNIIEH